MADVLAKVQEMKALFADIEAELQAAPAAPVDQSGAMADLQKQIDAKVKECDDLRAIIQVEIDDKKKDTSRLEAALEPVEPAPAPVIPDAPAAPAPSDSAAPADASAPAAPVDASSTAPAAAPSEDASPAGVNLDSPS